MILYVFIVLIITIAILLVLVVLAQNSKGGAGSAFGGSGASQMIGVKKSGDILEKLTWGFIVAIIVLSVGFNIIYGPVRKATPTPPEGGTEQPVSGAGTEAPQ